METDQPVCQGFLFLPPSGKILKKTWQKRYCVLHKKSSSGIARIEIYDNEAKTGQVKIITLEDVIKITPKPSNVINIVTKNSDMVFGTISEDHVNNWFEALKSVVFPEEGVNSIEEDNDLYCSADEGVFYVKLHPSEASQRCNLASKNYILVVAPSELQLRNDTDNKLLYTWPFSYIRKYGYKGGKFTFEAGRKCKSGEGVFYLEHPNHNEIYRCLSTKLKNMKKLLNGESTLSMMDCGELLHAAIGMEPGSRNPLPLSPSTPSSFHESSSSSVGIFPSSSLSSVDSVGLAKAVPKKPPRKSLPLKNLAQPLIPVVTVNTDPEYSYLNLPDQGKYDTVESRIDAWRTMGVQEPSHSESLSSEATYFSWGDNNLKKPVNEIKLSEKCSAPAVITEPTTSPVSQYYDCLQHFGSSNTLNVNSGYKKVVMNKSIENLSKSEEVLLPDCDGEYASWGTLTKSVNEMDLNENTQAPTVISEPIQSSEGYDHLTFFGQSGGLNTSSNYKQVISPSSASIPPAKESLNLYEEVNVMESARLADDSHLGYGRVKKDIISSVLKEPEERPKPLPTEDIKEEPQTVAHHFQNHQPYAVISKPKRV